ncbi:Alpha/Beta hydrolase protein [Aspergillus avenaceus]|uniref:acetylxylan esterase n=1 Tax=Aspergillus avenaceus TaxID=36643 RepID=A0A5N6TT94_ASPAV|nr:Alpha/Beta hydrolase protein [Aspergillus avenaceus]
MLFSSFASALLCGVSAVLAQRATLTQVTDFGSNPADIRMYLYVPDAVAASPGVVVSLHGASGNAQQQFKSTPYAKLAEQYGFVAIYPESPQGAWDATSAESRTHEGGGASQSIANMVKYVLDTYNAEASKVFVSGISSGGTMTNTLAAAYPDIFKGAVIYSAGSSDNIRDMYPGYTGSYPEIQLYLGSEDTVIGSDAFNSTLAAWAAVLGYDDTPDRVLGDTPRSGWTKYVLGSKLEGIWAQGVGHPVFTQGAEDMKWWGFAR